MPFSENASISDNEKFSDDTDIEIEDNVDTFLIEDNSIEDIKQPHDETVEIESNDGDEKKQRKLL